MKSSQYINNILHIEKTSLEAIASQVGTPCYIYSEATLKDNWQQFYSASDSRSCQICYAVKANPSLALLNRFAEWGAGFDVVSQGELERVLAAGGSPEKIIFSGVGKSVSDITRALDIGIQCFNVESVPELFRIHDLARKKNRIASIAFRINPDVNPHTHPHITTGFHENKFGIPLSQIPDLVDRLPDLPHVRLTGLSCHIGSQLVTLDPFLLAADRLIELYKKIRGKNIPLSHLNMGGGLGIRYQQETPPTIQEYVSALQKKMAGLEVSLILEPGRALLGDAGILLTRVEYIKKSHAKIFAIVDAGMNDLIRPALYEAWHAISPVHLRKDLQEETMDIVGPVCESADFLGKNRSLAIEQGALLAIHETAAYGASMGSNYNSRLKPPEILVKGECFSVIRAREQFQDLFASEIIPAQVTG